jgi:hypothetical protein
VGAAIAVPGSAWRRSADRVPRILLPLVADAPSSPGITEHCLQLDVLVHSDSDDGGVFVGAAQQRRPLVLIKPGGVNRPQRLRGPQPRGSHPWQGPDEGGVVGNEPGAHRCKWSSLDATTASARTTPSCVGPVEVAAAREKQQTDHVPGHGACDRRAGGASEPSAVDGPHPAEAAPALGTARHRSAVGYDETADEHRRYLPTHEGAQMPLSNVGPNHFPSLGIPEPMAPARGRSSVGAGVQIPSARRGIPEPMAPARVRPGPSLDPASVNPALENLIVTAADNRRITKNDALTMIDNIEVNGRRDIDVSILYQLLLRRPGLFDADSARETRRYLAKVTDIGGE